MWKKFGQNSAAERGHKTQPSRHMFVRLIKNLCETGSINPRKRNRRKTRTDKADELSVFGAVANNPHLCTRQSETYSGISKTSEHRILKRHKFHPYTYNYTRNCMGNSVQFCQWAQQQLKTDQLLFPKCSFY
jgi:hypothetical protein